MKLLLSILFIVSWCIENNQEKECFTREFESKKEAQHFYKIAVFESKDTNTDIKITNIDFYENE
jgi:hypothetical protein